MVGTSHVEWSPLQTHPIYQLKWKIEARTVKAWVSAWTLQRLPDVAYMAHWLVTSPFSCETCTHEDTILAAAALSDSHMTSFKPGPYPLFLAVKLKEDNWDRAMNTQGHT